MIKNILKSICYFALYFGLQIITLVCVFVYCVSSGIFVYSDLNNYDLLVEETITQLYPYSIPVLIISAIIFSIIFIAYKLIRKHPLDCKTIDFGKLTFFGLLGFFLNGTLSIIIDFLIQFMPQSFVDQLSLSTGLATTGLPIVVLLLGTGFLAPVLEELTFRYGICGTLSRSNRIVGLIVSSIIFGLIHGNPIQISYAIVLGFLFGVVYQKTDNVWYPIIIHAAINSSSVIVAATAPWMYPVFAAIGVIGYIVLIKVRPDLKITFKNKKESLEDNSNKE